MELCIRSAWLLNSNPSLSLDSVFRKASTSLPTSSIRFSRATFGPRKPSSPPPRIHLPRRPLSSSPPNGRHFRVSASSVAVAAEKDRLPGDIEVTEVEEPNSRVRLSVEVPPVVCEDCYRRVIKEFTKQAKVKCISASLGAV